MNSTETKVKFSDNGREALWNLSKPTIAMVDGFALGGGWKLVVHVISELSLNIKIGTRN
ncbi:MAG: hypothetical protein CM15mP8_4090 [Methanobacteriota archaeon]|nr:MAG: hypothetical protein CM15mP8_4090 [Euryarchaeota archaeon]